MMKIDVLLNIDINMKTVSSLKKRSKNCIIIKRKGILRIINKKNPRFKQRQK